MLRVSHAPHARSPQRVARAQTQSHSRQHFAHSTRTISAEGCARTDPIALSPAFRTLDTHDLRRGLRVHRPNRSLACISRTRHARSPQQVIIAPAQTQSHSRLHFAHSTRTISAEGCARRDPVALSPAFHALHTHDLRRGLRAPQTQSHSRLRRARSTRTISAEGCARVQTQSHSRLHFAHSTRTISAEGARAQTQSHSRLRFAHSTRTISAEGCARTDPIALSPAFRALDTSTCTISAEGCIFG